MMILVMKVEKNLIKTSIMGSIVESGMKKLTV
jgi:hypothetical protein